MACVLIAQMRAKCNIYYPVFNKEKNQLSENVNRKSKICIINCFTGNSGIVIGNDCVKKSFKN